MIATIENDVYVERLVIVQDQTKKIKYVMVYGYMYKYILREF